MELDTAVKYKVPLITLVYNNNCWGTWTSTAGLAAVGTPASLPGEHPLRPDRRSARRARRLRADAGGIARGAAGSYDVASTQGLPSLINVQAKKEFSSARDYPPGGGMGFEPGITGFQH